MKEDFEEQANEEAPEPQEGKNTPSGAEEGLIKVTVYPGRAAREGSGAAEIDDIEIAPIMRRRATTMSKLLNRELLPFFILNLLNIRSHFGIEIMAEIRQHGSLWSSSPGTIYPLLARLEKKGLIVGHWEKGLKRERHVYEITDTGRSHLATIRTQAILNAETAINALQEVLAEAKAPFKPTEPGITASMTPDDTQLPLGNS